MGNAIILKQIDKVFLCANLYIPNNKGLRMSEKREVQDIFELVEEIIRCVPVHVGIDPSGEMKRYTLISPDGQKICLDIIPSEEQDVTHYTIGSEDTIDMCVTLRRGRRIYLPSEERLLNLFKLVASKVAWQETQTIMRMEMGKTFGKNYKN